MAPADSARTRPEFGAGSDGTGAADPFVQWLRDAKAVRMDWGCFGIEKRQSPVPRKPRPRDCLGQLALSGLFPFMETGGDDRFSWP